MQKILRKFSLAMSSLTLAFMTVATVPVYAHDGSSGDSGNSDSTTTSTTDKSTTTENETETQATETEVHNSQDGARSRGAAMLETLREKHQADKAKTAADKTKLCEAHKHGLTTKFTHISTNAGNMKIRIDGFLAKAEAYKTDKNVTVDNWDTLVATAQAAGTKADASVSALKAVTPTVDCNSTSVAQDVATFKAAAQTARDDLKAYKSAVKDVFVALQKAKEASTITNTTTTTTEGSN